MVKGYGGSWVSYETNEIKIHEYVERDARRNAWYDTIIDFKKTHLRTKWSNRCEAQGRLENLSKLMPKSQNIERPEKAS